MWFYFGNCDAGHPVYMPPEKQQTRRSQKPYKIAGG